jgi:hypothetical protein
MVGGMTAAKVPWFLTVTLMVTWEGRNALKDPGGRGLYCDDDQIGQQVAQNSTGRECRAAGWNLLAAALLRERRRRRQSESGDDNCGEQFSVSHHDSAPFMRRELNGRLAIVVIFRSARLL